MATVTIGGLAGKTPLTTDEIEIQATAGGASNKATLAQIKTLMSDSPTLVTPNIGTPSAGVATNLTGLPTTGLADAAVTLAKMANLAQDQMIVRTTASTGVPQTATVTAAARTVLDDATVAAMVDTLGGASSSGTGGLARVTAPTLTTPTISGISTSDGANVTTANAMGALAIDVTKGLNTKSISTESTFTFSGTPATANTWFGIHVINSDTAPHILTFPSAFSQVTQAARTTCPIAASGQLYLLFRYDGSAYKVFGDAGFLNNYVATAAPGVTNDLDEGYGAGSLWLDATGNATYICESAANGAAVWHLLGGSGDMVLASVQTVTGAKTFGSAGAVGKLIVAGNTSGTTVIAAAAVAGTTTTTLPNANSTLPTYTQQITYAGPTAARTVTMPDADFSAGYLGLPQNSQSAAYTTVLTDAGKHILHPSADTTARIFTIDSNANVAYPVGTTLTFVNQNAGGVITIAITTDTLRLAGAGTTGSRTLAANGIATAVKVTTTEWLINGTGLT